MNLTPKQKTIINEALVDFMRKYRECHAMLTKDRDKKACVDLIHDAMRAKLLVIGE